MPQLSQFVPFLLTFLSKEDHMLFIAGFVLGAVVGGLVGAFLLPLLWTPKK